MKFQLKSHLNDYLMILLLNFFQFILALVAFRIKLSSSACRDGFTQLMCTALSMPLKATDISNSILKMLIQISIIGFQHVDLGLSVVEMSFPNSAIN